MGSTTIYSSCSELIIFSTIHREDLFDNCFLIMDSASCMLTFMEDDKIDFKRSEYHWIGVSSYNLGIIAQNDIPLTRVIGFLQLSVSNLRKWLKNGQSDVLIKLQQVLMFYMRFLTGILKISELYHQYVSDVL